MKKVQFILLILSAIVVLEKDAYAYIDPGSGSIMLQMLVAGLLGAAFTLKTYWRRIVSYFKKDFTEQETVTEEEKPENE